MAQTSNKYIYPILSIVFIFSITVECSVGTSSILNVTISSSNNTKADVITNKTLDHATNRGREGVVSDPKEESSSKPIILDENPKNKTSSNSTLHVYPNHTQAVTKATTTVSSTPISKATTTTTATTTSTTTTTATTTKTTTTKPRKPLLTEHDYVDLPAAKPEVDNPSIIHIDSAMDKKVRRADYIVPIVAVILSVPLVAIIISVLYKRGKDWWTHRNYRRMDYLIEGMYNS